MKEYTCSCGFVSPKATAFFKHLQAGAQAESEHRLVPSAHAAPPDSKSEAGLVTGVEAISAILPATDQESEGQFFKRPETAPLPYTSRITRSKTAALTTRRPSTSHDPKATTLPPSKGASDLPELPHDDSHPPRLSTDEAPPNGTSASQYLSQPSASIGNTATSNEKPTTGIQNLIHPSSPDSASQKAPPHTRDDPTRFNTTINPAFAAAQTHSHADSLMDTVRGALTLRLKARAGVETPVTGSMRESASPVSMEIDQAPLSQARGRGGSHAVEWLEGVLLWRDAWTSVKCLLGGLYGILCCQQVSARWLACHPATVAGGALICAVVLNVGATRVPLVGSAINRILVAYPCRNMLEFLLPAGTLPPPRVTPTSLPDSPYSQSPIRGSQSNVFTLALTSPTISNLLSSAVANVRSSLSTSGTSSSDLPLPVSEPAPQPTTSVQPARTLDPWWVAPRQVNNASTWLGVRQPTETEVSTAVSHAMHRCAAIVVPIVAASAVLTWRTVTCTRPAHVSLVLTLLWLLLVLSESGWFTTSSIALLVYASAFVIPFVYTSRDAHVDTAFVHATTTASTVLRAQHRRSVWIAIAIGAIVGFFCNTGIVLRMTYGAAAAAAVLVWRVGVEATPVDTNRGTARLESGGQTES